MGEDQRNEEFETPPVEKIPGISRRHVALLETTTNEADWVRAGMRHLILYTRGRRSGREHKVALPYWCDSDGTRIVVASFAGSPKHPAWYHNLADKRANPTVRIRDREEDVVVEARILEGAEYDRTWAALVRDRPFFSEYQARCDRRIPLIRLPARERSAEEAQLSTATSDQKSRGSFR